MRILLVLAVAACATPARSAPEPDPYAAHIVKLRKDLAAKGLKKLSFRSERPFVVVGNAGSEALAEDATTVRWAVAMLEQDFFIAKPSKILDVYLFRDAKSYERGVRTLTGELPSTPYGFYSSKFSGLFMNIATGGGTLVHEIVHPYVEADFPDAPPWLNEGLGSLFEQSADRDGHIIGLTNWRLAGLQTAIDDDSVPTFWSLTHLDTDQFYGDDAGVNYSTARYLLYYLQQKGLLRDFYKAFRANHRDDPSGYTTLQKILGENDMVDFQDRWQAYVAKLTFP